MTDLNVLTTVTNDFSDVFRGYAHQFLQWGQMFFYTCAIITIVWLCLWRAFDEASFHESMPKFIREFFVLALFYTIMINAVPWLDSLVQTTSIMGKTLAHFEPDPSSIITKALGITDSLIMAPSLSGWFGKEIEGALMVTITYLVVFVAFASVAINVAVTQIMIAFLISMSGLLLAFAAFPFTRSVARNTLDVVVAKCFKLLALYAVIGGGSTIFDTMANLVPQGKITSLDIYGLMIVCAILFWAVCHNIPTQIERIVSQTIHEHRGGEVAALALSATNIAKSAVRGKAQEYNRAQEEKRREKRAEKKAASAGDKKNDKGNAGSGSDKPKASWNQ